MQNIAYRKDGVQYEYNSLYHKAKYGLKKFLEDKKSYNRSVRGISKLRYNYRVKAPEFKMVNPDEVRSMQLDCKSTDQPFKLNFDKVPLHSTDKARFNPYHKSGIVKDGEWDKFTKPHRFDRVFKGVRKHYEEDINWEETEYFKQYKLREEIYQENGYAEREIQKTEKLYREIKKHGFKTRFERDLLTSNREPYVKTGQWPITINIGRDGEYVFNNTGHNRLAISKILELEQIPVLPVCTHKKWAEKSKIDYR